MHDPGEQQVQTSGDIVLTPNYLPKTAWATTGATTSFV